MNCLHCNNIIQGKESKKYCSNACKMKSYRNANRNEKGVTVTKSNQNVTVTANENVTVTDKNLNLLIQGNYKECECLTYKNTCEHLTKQERNAIVQGKKKRLIEYLLNDKRMKNNVFYFGDVRVTP